MTIIKEFERAVDGVYDRFLQPTRMILGTDKYNDLREALSIPAYLPLGQYCGIPILIDPVNLDRIYCEGYIPTSSGRVPSYA
jgi:hypothetical protein